MTPVKRAKCPNFLEVFLEGRRLEEYGASGSLQASIAWSSLKEIKREIQAHLSGMFVDVCCYCETLIAQDGVVERFRPESQYPQFYLHWENLYWACPVCSRYKADRFPLENGEFSSSAEYSEAISSERPLLLDPCLDNADDHLRFLSDGSVKPLSERGRVTIDTLDLNRRQLILSRLEQISIIPRSTQSERASHQVNGSHRAVWRQLTKEMTFPEYSYVYPKLPSSSPFSDDFYQRILDQVLGEDGGAAINTEAGEGFDEYRAQSQYVTRIEIKCFGPIDDLVLDLDQSQSAGAPCFALLGENGVGKSTVLRALALALAGKSYAKSLGFTSNKVLSPNAYEGFVKVSLVGNRSVVMSFRRNAPIRFSVDSSQSLVLAYGATRLLPRGRHKPKPGRDHAKIDNLFDPFLPLNHPEEWLEMQDEERLREINTVLSNLMPKESEVRVVLDDDFSVTLSVDGLTGTQIQNLSDGYQSMLGISVDIMKVLYRTGSSIDSAEGIVIIDELGNHFHPAWRLQCLSALRLAFPRAQFIYSTHDPLCLRGLCEGEVAVLRKDMNGQVYVLEDLPNVARLSVEQLLSSEHFGLRSTVDPQLESDIKTYEKLLEQPHRTVEDEQELVRLIDLLTDVRYLGGSRRERIALQLVDAAGKFDRPASPNVSAQQLSQKTLARLKLLIEGIAPASGSQESGA
ncbi:TIGR02646 family protein [Pseudomonas sichuanensis]|uniref:retron system putative HNH endonuclease n=1 Tax=Pseudomonas sichuanensis TaxID=2213015 RepID=UPI00244B2DC3|nr:retron system putative HNH endonuclease [Pseudomonas sichuanensis]MDH0733017.1 TIGR02646 family protein [Pseudomonas sichuanensis]MDH1585359.1 TIGR02646 family protein [Pseudomonas sichuanensis]MDH1593129.1 TIGR02646 family protein [Pseudomonas sichuanensis]MDH1600656.1 TIGR02646 family protein [Pseudomonas sichuanensis]